tara:strand:- start:196 stop:723 length:528 start_codon:yes stop_codon:yes gene_type:complete
MKGFFKIFFVLVILSFSWINSLSAEVPYFIDFSKVLNQSNAGKEAQDFLKKRFESESKKFSEQEKKLRKEESDLIAKKKLITNEEYQKKVETLRKKVSDLQKNKQNSLKNIGKMRAKARTELLKNLNPIMKKYMEDNKIRMVLDKKSILLGDKNLDLTEKIIKLLNKELKSIKLN